MRPMLSVYITPLQGEGQFEAIADLSDGLVNNNGDFEFRLDLVPEEERIVIAT